MITQRLPLVLQRQLHNILQQVIPMTLLPPVKKLKPRQIRRQQRHRQDAEGEVQLRRKRVSRRICLRIDPGAKNAAGIGEDEAEGDRRGAACM